ncbi:MAG TPA: hypothetical protein VFQ07_12390, partial [Candidatus Polarisedimenticolia bacterium]|nr:hypothetical protein [Candidatus Polarisedimenticolia bacterium]
MRRFLPLLGAVLACGLLLAPTAEAAGPQATMRGARAIAPPSAPPSVKAMIAAANRIRHRPYRWGGGHR